MIPGMIAFAFYLINRSRRLLHLCLVTSNSDNGSVVVIIGNDDDDDDDDDRFFPFPSSAVYSLIL